MKPFISLLLFLALLPLALHAQNHVGIGTSSPDARLHVVGNDGVLFEGSFGSGSLPATGAGVRMMWFPGKAAFRVGEVNGTHWNIDSIGDHSFASGESTKALEDYSFAHGYGVTAGENGAVAFGAQTNAMGHYSFASGYYAEATGTRSFAHGDNPHASGDNSVAFGRWAEAQSYAEVVFGRYNAESNGDPNTWVATDPAFVIGNGSNLSARSNAFTVLKNGFTGINTADPLRALHLLGSDTLGAVLVAPNTSVNENSELILAEDDDFTYGMFFRYNGTDNQLELWGKSFNNYYGPHMTVSRSGGTEFLDQVTFSDQVQFENSEIEVFDGSQTLMGALMPNGNGSAGELNLYDGSGDLTVELRGAETSGQGAEVRLYDATGSETINFDADYNGNGRIITDELEITGGADLAEAFDVKGLPEVAPEPGMVVSINPDQPGKLAVAQQAYDRKVAGVISGANGIRPGMQMGQEATIASGEYPVALTGRVYVKADAAYGAIKPGDLLTSSPTPGHAMKVTNHDQAPGAVIGKAMTDLDEGQGYVLILISLQ